MDTSDWIEKMRYLEEEEEKTRRGNVFESFEKLKRILLKRSDRITFETKSPRNKVGSRAGSQFTGRFIAFPSLISQLCVSSYKASVHVSRSQLLPGQQGGPSFSSTSSFFFSESFLSDLSPVPRPTFPLPTDGRQDRCAWMCIRNDAWRPRDREKVEHRKGKRRVRAYDGERRREGRKKEGRERGRGKKGPRGTNEDSVFEGTRRKLVMVMRRCNDSRCLALLWLPLPLPRQWSSRGRLHLLRLIVRDGCYPCEAAMPQIAASPCAHCARARVSQPSATPPWSPPPRRCIVV